MRKKKTPEAEYEDLIKKLMSSYDRWNEIYRHGANDPAWPDGVNLNLVHNHILHYGKRIAELASKHEFPLPDAFDLPIPPEVDKDYMARRDEIRDNAKHALKAYESDANFRKIASVVKSIGNEHKAAIASGILRYVSSLRDAIMNNDYVIMRRHDNPELYLRSAKVFVEELKEDDFKAQMSLDSCINYEYEDEEMEL